MESILRLPSIKSLRTFQVAGRYMSFKQAGETLYITPSAVSHQIKNLESFLGLELFQRKARGLEFTAPGQRYFEFLDEMFCRLESETHQIRSEFERKALRLCVPPFFASELLLPKLTLLQHMLPDIDLRITTQPSVMKTHPRDADVSILLGVDEWPDLETYALFPKRMVAACSPAFKKKHGLKSFAELEGLTLLIHEHRPYTWNTWAKALNRTAPKAGKVFQFDSMTSVVQAAVEGLGVAIVSWPLSKQWLDSGALVRAIDEDVDSRENFYLAHRAEDMGRSDVAALVKWILKEFVAMGEIK